jgi:selenocysteine-specific elongation factor
MPLIIGTAGHIDHGKTALVRALTGQDTDRLQEEKARGISIDLGFAWLDTPDGARVGIVDVPGHEKFIRNMLAGAHGIDLVLFTVAADDGVMPQTEEHLDILHLLGVRRGIFVITKADLVDAARVAAVREEIEILSLGTTLEGSPVVPVSTVTGAGIEDAGGLGICSVPASLFGGPGASPIDPRPRPRPDTFAFRSIVPLPSAATASSSPARRWPGRSPPVTRSACCHAAPRPGCAGSRCTERRCRAPVAASAAPSTWAGSSSLMCSAATWCATRTSSARLLAWRRASSFGRVRAAGSRATPESGCTSEPRRCSGGSSFDGSPAQRPGSSGGGQLVLRTPILAVRGDRFVVRDETARWTLGGGVVVNPFARRRRRGERASVTLLERMHGGNDAEAAAAFLEATPEFAVTAATLAQALGVREERAAEVAAGMDDVICVKELFGGPGASSNAPASSIVARRTWEVFARAVVDAVASQHRAEPLSPGLDAESLRTGLPWDLNPRVFRWAIDRLVAAGDLARAERFVHLPSHRVALSAASRASAEVIERLLDEGGMTPPDLRQLAQAAGTSSAELLEVLRVLEQERRVVRIAPDLFYARRPADEALGRLTAHCRTHGEVTAAAFRDLIGASRKFAIAFLDWTDRTGLTLRIGDVRRLRR